MRTIQQWQLALGLVIAGVTGAVHNAAARPLDNETTFIIHVRNYAEPGAKELAEAELFAAGVFRQAGIATRWVEDGDASDASTLSSAVENLNNHCNIYVAIQSQMMTDRLTVPNNAMGLAPGSGPDRKLVYVFYDRAKDLARRQVADKVRGLVAVRAGISQILGEMIAHEIGHVLLNLPSHTDTGIMRGYWDLKDLQLVAYGSLLFTEQQAEVIQVEVARRSRGQRSW